MLFNKSPYKRYEDFARLSYAAFSGRVGKRIFVVEGWKAAALLAAWHGAVLAIGGWIFP